MGVNRLENMKSKNLTIIILEVKTDHDVLGKNDGAFMVTANWRNPTIQTINNDADFIQDKFDYDELPAGELKINIIDANDCRKDLLIIIDP